MRRYVSVLTILTVVSGCAYEPVRPAAIRAKDFYAYRTSEGPLTMAVRPITRGGESSLSLGADLNAKDILPLEIVVFNDSPEALDLGRGQIQVTGEDDREIAVLPPEEVYRRVKRSTAKRTLGWSLVGSIPFFLLTIPMGFFAWRDSHKANKQNREVLAAAGQMPEVIGANETARWITYVNVPAETDSAQAFQEPKDLLIALSGIRDPQSSEPLNLAIAFQARQ